MQQTIPQYPSLQLPHHPLHTISTTNGITKTTEVQSTVDTSTAETVVATATIIEDIQTSSALTPWIFKGVNMAELFTKFQKAVQKISTDRLFFIESSVHELLALSDIFLLCPGQYSPLCIHIFIEDVLSDLNKELLTECMDFKQDTNDDACMKLSRIINNVESNRLSKDDAEIDLLMLGKSLNSFERSLVWGVKAGMRKLPLKPIKIRKFFGECELFTMYFDPILCALFSDPDKNVLLRWSNVTSDESREIRPDAIISEIYQRDFGPSCGYGEAKLARPTTDNHALCYDLLCLATLAKDTIDTNKLQAALAFQINGFNITFYLSRLRHDGMYIMQEIGRLAFPRSLEKLASFVNSKNIRTLLMITEVFWRLCQPVNDKELWKTKRRPTCRTIYSLIDATKDRHRFCALHFE